MVSPLLDLTVAWLDQGGVHELKPPLPGATHDLVLQPALDHLVSAWSTVDELAVFKRPTYLLAGQHCLQPQRVLDCLGFKVVGLWGSPLASRASEQHDRHNQEGTACPTYGCLSPRIMAKCHANQSSYPTCVPNMKMVFHSALG